MENQQCMLNRNSKKHGDFNTTVVMAVKVLEKTFNLHDHADSVTKDIASLLHVMGKAEVAIQYLGQVTDTSWRFRKLHASLLYYLTTIRTKPVSPVCSRVVYVEISPCIGKISIGILRKLFPNMSKVWRIMLSQSEQSCLLEFASHSSARRAVDARQPPLQLSHSTSTPTSSYLDSVKCAWVSPLVDIPPLVLGDEWNLPVVEFISDSLIIPSNDWRRPRPTNSSAISSCASESRNILSSNTCNILGSILRMTGAFDDYPPDDNNQIFN